LAALGLIAFLTPAAKADSFVYNVTSTEGGIDVTFALPSFQEVVTTTTFIQNTPIQGPLNEFILSGNSTDQCVYYSCWPVLGRICTFDSNNVPDDRFPRFHWSGHVHGELFRHHDDVHHYGGAHLGPRNVRPNRLRHLRISVPFKISFTNSPTRQSRKLIESSICSPV
jgi:hypothetical protein